MGFIKKIKQKLFGKTNEEVISDLVSRGAQIGKGVIIFDTKNTLIDGTRPWLIEIGDYTKITRGVIILTHDYSLSVLRRVYGEWLGEGAKTVIGKNCFIGVNSTILMGSHIGDNVVVGAGSVVNGIIPDNVVVAGNPARIICSLDEYYKKRKDKTIIECKECAKEYYKKNGRFPTEKDLTGFKFLFMPRDKMMIEEAGLNFICNGDEPLEVEEAFYSSVPYWNGFDKLINEIKEELSKEI